jgi:hypothetical protein
MKAAVASTARAAKLPQHLQGLGHIMRLLIALLLSLSLGSAAQAQTKTLSDAEARDVISADWNALVGWLLIGERLVASDTPPGDCKAELISTLQYDFLLNAERAGLVTIKYWDSRGDFLKEKDYTNKEKIEFAVTGKLQKMTILPTKEAQQEQVKLDVTGRTGCMSFKVGDYKIETVTENRPLRKGTTDLAAVSINYRVDYRPIYRKVYTAGNIKIDNIRKANVLLRFDPSNKRWHVIAFDAANIGEEIRPVNIPQVYERIQ